MEDNMGPADPTTKAKTSTTNGMGDNMGPADPTTKAKESTTTNGMEDNMGPADPTTKAKTSGTTTTTGMDSNMDTTTTTTGMDSNMDTTKPDKTACKVQKYKGDGNCDDGNNNAGCHFDGGDCCAKSMGGPVKKDY